MSPTPSRRPIIVQKYGGSSVADVERLGRVADRVVATREAGFDVVVVVSAMGKATDGLLELASSAGNRSNDPPPRRELDMLVSTGERVSMALLSIAIQARGVDAISFTGSQSGILTNDRHFDARIIEVRPHRIEDELARGRVVIVAGYQGMSYRREITTLGRGGSDTTAVALAAALEADRCEIYSDVDGVYAADPRQVPNAPHLPEVDPDTLQEMAEAGAKVLCAQAVEWAQRSGIALYARSTFDPIGEGQATIVRRNPPMQKDVRAIVRDPSVARISGQVEALGVVLNALRDLSLVARDLHSDGTHLDLWVSLSNHPGFLPSRVQAIDSRLDVELGLSAVSVVGQGLTELEAGVLDTFVSVLDVENVAARRTTCSPLRLTALVGEFEARKLERAFGIALLRP